MITYDTANTILNAARQRVGEKMASLLANRGNFMDRTQADTQAAFNAAFRKLQEILVDMGYPQLTAYDTLAAIPATTNFDPNYLLSLDIASSPALPTNLIQPLDLWERQSVPAGTVPLQFGEMTKVYNGIPRVGKLPFNENWEWRTDTLYLPGATVPMDLLLLYASYLPDIADTTTQPWYTQPVAIARCLEAMADLVCAEFVAKQDPDAAAAFYAAAQDSAKLIGKRDTLAERAPNKGAELSRMGGTVPPVEVGA